MDGLWLSLSLSKSSLIIRKRARELLLARPWQMHFGLERSSLGQGHQELFALSSCLYCDVRWYSGLQNGFRLLPLSPLLPFGSIQTQALSKLAVQRCKSLMKTDTSKSSSLTSNNPPTLFWSVRFGFTVIAKRSCKIFSYISIFIIYACGSLFICFIASCLSSVFMVEVHMTPNWYNAIRFCEGFFFQGATSKH